MIRRMCTNGWRLLVVIVCQSLVFQPAFSQQAGLRIVIIEGDGFRNVIQQIPPRPVSVRILDAGNRPVAGAMVLFIAPERGPSGEFANDSTSLTVTTGADGLASAGAYHPNAVAGPYQIRVRADFQGQTGTAVIAQTNIAQKKGHGKAILIVALAGAAAAAVAASRSGKSTASTAPTITFGGSAVGAPK